MLNRFFYYIYGNYSNDNCYISCHKIKCIAFYYHYNSYLHCKKPLIKHIDE